MNEERNYRKGNEKEEIKVCGKLKESHHQPKVPK